MTYSEVLSSLKHPLIWKQILLHLEGKRKRKGLAIDFWTLVFWQFWNPFLIFKHAFLSCADTYTQAHMQDIFWSVLSQQTARIKLSQVLKHNDTWRKKKKNGNCYEREVGAKQLGYLPCKWQASKIMGRGWEKFRKQLQQKKTKAYVVATCSGVTLTSLWNWDVNMAA